MKILITGGAGFIGRALARSLLQRGAVTGPSGNPEPIDHLVLLDSVDQSPFPDGGDVVEYVVSDLSTPGLASALIDRDDISVFHLASMVSGGCEVDFDGALAVNLDGSRSIFEACRARATSPRVVFSSSIAVFGGPLALDTVSDLTKLTPETTYGMTKALCELLINDYSRKGFLDGRSARLPTVIIRPGRPNAAASSWVSGIFREPLSGEECIVPVGPTTRVPLSGYRTVVENLIRLHEAPASSFGTDRSVNLPSIEVTAKEMERAVSESEGRPLGRIAYVPDQRIIDIYRSWPQSSSFEFATRLGLARDDSLKSIIAGYIEDFVNIPAE